MIMIEQALIDQLEKEGYVIVPRDENGRMREALKAVLAASETGFPEALQMAREAIAKAEEPGVEQDDLPTAADVRGILRCGS